MEMKFNTNTVIGLIITALGASVGWLTIDKLDTIRNTQEQMWRAIMPRPEIETRLVAIKQAQDELSAENNRAHADLESQLIVIRTRQTELEISLARLTGHRPAKEPSGKTE